MVYIVCMCVQLCDNQQDAGDPSGFTHNCSCDTPGFCTTCNKNVLYNMNVLYTIAVGLARRLLLVVISMHCDIHSWLHIYTCDILVV